MRQLPDERYRWDYGESQPLCYECEALTDLYRYTLNGVALWFCSPLCASRYAFRLGLAIDHIDRTLSKPYNGAYMGYSPFDMDADECRPRRDYDPCDDTEDDDGDYDCCDDAEDYGEEGYDSAEND